MIFLTNNITSYIIYAHKKAVKNFIGLQRDAFYEAFFRGICGNNLLVETGDNLP